MARSPRRTFANPFVVTLAAIPACYVESTPPPQQPQPRPPVAQGPTQGPAQPTQPATPEVVVANPPRPTPPPTTPPPSGNTATFDQYWYVTKSGASCTARAKVDCPKPAKKGDPVPTCNPPPPIAYACPPDMTEASLTIVQRAGSETCMVDHGPMSCPKGAMCNPPPPRAVACPKY
jgi:hypothetical protein